MIDRSDTHWYRDAIIYQVHVKSFFDSDDDGVGDFAGLTAKLDYIRELGVTAIWVMPFFPSPLRDDGYDIADYREINPSYGTMRDFRRFVREAHERGIRVVIELVINHTSDQHPWFQRARRAKAGSAWRNFYVWSDNDEKYDGTRIIFLDTEKSNWTWDPVAGAYYWHRFYSHQPDLNFDNPRVLEAVIDTMYYWLDMGIDGLRLDAIPYLIEREGTNCENVPETHDVIKKIRAALDARYPDRMLLAEANQWPEDTAPYFGDGDECHMAFHFPLMPRMYMAVAQEERNPITDIMRQTPEIPAGCQWAIFLRNHDELTLEMVTERERDYLWKFYASDRRARINLGIRRRLAPLLENDRRKTELLISLLLSMPGTPVLYYGDEIGMGDNIYLGDRDGVRTPMQWSPDRNGGFSRTDPARLFLPAIQDPIYGFDAVNVESQRRSPASLLNWLRRMIAVRRGTQVFGRGSLRFIFPQNRKILAYLREMDDESVLCVVNLSRAPQAVELDLSEYRGRRPVEMSAGSAFPPIGDLPYLLMLPAYGFYWFNLDGSTALEEHFTAPNVPELFTLVLTGPVESLLTGREKIAFERDVMPGWIESRRWFTGKGAKVASVSVIDMATLPGRDDEHDFLLPCISVTLRGGDRDGVRQDYFTPLAIDEAEEDESLLPFAVARVRRGPRIGLLYGAASAPEFTLAMFKAMRDGQVLPTTTGGCYRFSATSLLDEHAEIDPEDIARVTLEKNNTFIAIGSRMVLKLYRRLHPGINPEVAMGRFLTETAPFRNMPAVLGSVEHVDADGVVTSVALLERYVRHQGDAWRLAVEATKRELDHLAILPEEEMPSVAEAFGIFRHYPVTLGLRTAEMHMALATPTDDAAFAAEPLGLDDVSMMASDARIQAERAFAALEHFTAQPAAPGTHQALAQEAAGMLLARRAECEALIERLAQQPLGAIKSRIHGDYHLGQVLIVEDDVMIVDFAGESLRPLEERERKTTPLRDVAGMLRSFAYMAGVAAREVSARLPESHQRTQSFAHAWSKLATESFMLTYEATCAGSAVWTDDAPTRRRLLNLALLGKAFYEINYEAGHRPEWLDIPIEGVLAVLDEHP